METLPLGFPGTKFPVRRAVSSAADCAGRGHGAGAAHPSACPLLQELLWTSRAARSQGPSRSVLTTGHHREQSGILCQFSQVFAEAEHIGRGQSKWTV